MSPTRGSNLWGSRSIFQILDIHEEIHLCFKSVFMVDVRFELTTNDPWPADDAKREVTLDVIPVTLRRLAYDARSRCHSLVWLLLDGESSFIPFLARWRLNPGLVPRPETPAFPSKIRLPSNTNTIPIPVPR